MQHQITTEWFERKSKLNNHKLNKQITTMNNLRNSVRLIGNLGMNPESREIAADRKVVKFSIATSETHKDKQGNKIVDTQWHNITCWGKQAEIAEKYLQKGSEVAVEGKLVNRSYTDKNGVKKFSTEIVVNELLLMGKKN